MNFSPLTRAWLQLICLAIGSGATVGTTSYLGGAKPWIAALCGLGTAATNVYHALANSPADKAASAAPFAPAIPPAKSNPSKNESV